ncbi:MAG: PAS domain S-box protein, partial [Geobacteraceae bacterium]|nr:PAS domain S-box protein [Geobacteraceae bacterium]
MCDISHSPKSPGPVRPAATPQSVSHAAPDLYFLMDADGAILDYHAGDPADLHAAPESFLGRQVQDILPPAAAGEILQAASRVLKTGKMVSLDYSLPLGSGEQTFEARLLPLFARQLIVMVRNITRHRRTEEALRQVEERFRSIFRNISAGMVLLNPDGSFIEANAAFCAFLGYDCRELLKLNVMDITHPDDREGALRRLHEARGGSRQTYNSGKRYLRKDGTTV